MVMIVKKVIKFLGICVLFSSTLFGMEYKNIVYAGLTGTFLVAVPLYIYQPDACARLATQDPQKCFTILGTGFCAAALYRVCTQLKDPQPLVVAPTPVVPKPLPRQTQRLPLSDRIKLRKKEYPKCWPTSIE